MHDNTGLFEMNKHFNDNLERYLEKHPGEFALVGPREQGGLSVVFYSTESRAKKAAARRYGEPSDVRYLIKHVVNPNAHNPSAWKVQGKKTEAKTKTAR